MSKFSIWKANVLGMLLGYEWELQIQYTGMSLHEIMWIECLDTHMFITLTLAVLVYLKHAHHLVETQLATLYIWLR